MEPQRLSLAGNRQIKDRINDWKSRCLYRLAETIYIYIYINIYKNGRGRQVEVARERVEPSRARRFRGRDHQAPLSRGVSRWISMMESSVDWMSRFRTLPAKCVIGALSLPPSSCRCSCRCFCPIQSRWWNESAREAWRLDIRLLFQFY